MIARVASEEFFIGGARVYPLDLKIQTTLGEQALSPIGMELLCELARAKGGPVSAEHLILQIWGAKTPDEGTIEHYVAELNYKLAAKSTGTAIVNSETAGFHNLSVLPRQLETSELFANELHTPKSVNEPKICFFEELRKRKVSQTGVLYLVALWLILQFTDVTFSTLGLGDEVVRLILVTVVIGFPLNIPRRIVHHLD
ncbi:MAG: DNA-binding winged helix-turn-helix (wHTH) protein [Pseudoalteromonas tetraodonis]